MSIKSKIFDITLDGIKSTYTFNPYLKLSLLESTQNYPKYKAINEPEENKELKFISKKRGRKNKDLEEQNNDLIKERKIHNKFSNDNVNRRIKALFHNYMINLLNNLMSQYFKENTKKFVKINSKITKDIGIEYNRKILNKKIKDIIIEVSDKYQNKENNKECIKYIESKIDNEKIVKILNMSYRELYTNYYLKSVNTSDLNSFEEHKRKLLKEYGEEYLERFVENANQFIDFFTNGKNRKSRKRNDIEFISRSSENDNLETINTTELTNDESIKNYYSLKNMVSSYTQTDIMDINSKIIVFS
jgi:hypothetical protein